MVRKPTSVRSAFGFTLIEVMVVLVIIGILGAIAYPSYRRYTTETRRSDAHIALTQIANLQERFFTECNTYASSLTAAKTCAAGGLNTVTTSPGGHYQLQLQQGILQNDGVTVAAACSSWPCGYTVIATPVAGGLQAGDGAFMLNARGQKFWDRNNDGDYADAGENKWTK